MSLLVDLLITSIFEIHNFILDNTTWLVSDKVQRLTFWLSLEHQFLVFRWRHGGHLCCPNKRVWTFRNSTLFQCKNDTTTFFRFGTQKWPPLTPHPVGANKQLIETTEAFFPLWRVIKYNEDSVFFTLWRHFLPRKLSIKKRKSTKVFDVPWRTSSLCGHWEFQPWLVYF